ncbi:hypothetical protein U91I_03605 [alpha proteobacterium U9-1i]|nr:hypothetical protein U91I_03605 [alpha proteobacterium U9-1i]
MDMRSPKATFDLRAALSEEIRNALVEFETAPDKPKAVHRCRVRLKRARSLARIGRTCAPGLANVFNQSARSLMHTLAHARDFAALAETARGLGDKSGAKTAAALNAVAASFDARRASLPAMNLDATRAALRDLMALAQVWPEASARQIDRGARRIIRRARIAHRRGDGHRTAQRRHEWRKREKDRLYAVTLLGESWPDDRARRAGLNERLSDMLGRERDVLLLIDHIEAEPYLAGGEEAAKRALKRLKRREKRLAKRADALGAKLHEGRA